MQPVLEAVVVYAEVGVLLLHFDGVEEVACLVEAFGAYQVASCKELLEWDILVPLDGPEELQDDQEEHLDDPEELRDDPAMPHS